MTIPRNDPSDPNFDLLAMTNAALEDEASRLAFDLPVVTVESAARQDAIASMLHVRISPDCPEYARPGACPSCGGRAGFNSLAACADGHNLLDGNDCPEAPARKTHVEAADLHSSSPYRYVVDASELGWPPGFAPPHRLTTSVGNGCPFLLVHDVDIHSGGWLYRQGNGCLDLIVWND